MARYPYTLAFSQSCMPLSLTYTTILLTLPYPHCLTPALLTLPYPCPPRVEFGAPAVMLLGLTGVGKSMMMHVLSGRQM